MEYVVTENHRTEFSDPIILKQGEKVIIGEESSADWPGWIFCAKINGSNKGWVPKQIIMYEKDYGIIAEDYSAKELDIDRGITVEGIKELNGLLWGKNNSSNEIGWIPMKKLEQARS